MGMHSGVNAVSGDFSLGAKGFMVENGKIIRSVNQITIAGNFFELLKDIEAVGNDLDFGSDCFGSPTLLVKALSVAGK
jgi:PmbA protein